MIEDEKCPICGFIFDSCKHTLIEVFIYAERVRDERNTLRKQLDIAVEALKFSKDFMENNPYAKQVNQLDYIEFYEKIRIALAEVEKIGGMNVQR
jgi:hypothetical protein